MCFSASPGGKKVHAKRAKSGQIKRENERVAYLQWGKGGSSGWGRGIGNL